MRYTLFAITLLVLMGCKPSNTDKRPIITVSIEPLRFFTDAIVGDKYKVVTLVPQGNNPETYEPTAQQMVDLTQSRLYVKVGWIGFERTRLPQIIQNAPHTTLVDSSDGVEMVESGVHHVHTHDQMPHHAAENDITADPHIWLSCKNAKVMAQNIYKAVVKDMPKDSVFFKQRLDKLIAQIEQTDKRIRQEWSKGKQESFLIYHPILTYFAKEYGLQQIALEQEGREPSVAQLQKMLMGAQQKQVKTLLVFKAYNTKSVQMVATTLQIEPTTIDPLAYNWCNEMVVIAQALKK